MMEKISKTKILFVSIVFLLVAFTDISAADTQVSGTISTDTTWTVSGSPYIVTGDIVIYNSTNTPTLTIEPGVTVSFNQYTRLNVGSGNYGGRLIADNVIFTGNSATNGWWGGIFFDQNSDGSIINNSRIMYGGYLYNANIYLNSASVNITNSIIAESSNYGIYSSSNGDKINIIGNRIQNNINFGIYSTGSGSAVVFNNQISNNIGGGAYFDSGSYSSLIAQNNVFAGNGNYPLTFNAAYIDSVKDNTFTANVPNEIQLLGGTISGPVSQLRNQKVPYRIVGDISIYKISVAPATLIINPGITLKFNQYTRFNVGSGSYGGRLIADNVTFTGSSPTNGWWGGIFFDQNSDGSIINNSRIMYGGYLYNANIYLNSASVNITNSIIAESSNYGIYSSSNGDKINIIGNRIQNNINFGIYSTGSGLAIVKNNQISNNIGGGAYFDSGSYSSLIAQNNVFAGNGNYPLTFNAAYIDSVKDNTFTANVPNEIQLLGGTISGPVSTLRNQGVPYRVTGDISIYKISVAPATLIINPGITLKFNQYTRFNVGSGSYGGRLIADNVIFTGSSPTNGWWGGIFFDQNSDGSIINNSRVMHGGYWYGANIYLNSASVNITNSIIAESSNYGIYSSGNGDKINIIGNRIQNNINFGIYSTGSGSAVVFNNRISNNIGGGAYFDSGSYSSLIAQNNVFAGNGNYPLTFNAAYIDSVKDNTFTANVPNEIQLLGGTISGPVSTIRNQEVPYIVTGDISVYKISVSPATLIINPGITLKFNQYTRLNVGSGSYGGRLIADNVTFIGSSATNGWWGGIYFDQNSDGSMINNSRVMYGGYWYSANIYLNSASINITNSTIANSGYYGIYSIGSTSALIKDNHISNNEYGLSLSSSSGSIIYNNYFNNTNNVLFGSTTYNTWNTNKQAGINIVGGPYLGGNFWANPEDSGFSQTCTDSDSDGICDSSYILDTNNIDYLPLARIA